MNSENASAGHPFNREFLGLCLIVVAAFCNISVFYTFYHYLEGIKIPVAWRGVLVGLEPMAAFALRLFVLPWLHLRNAYGVAMVSLALLIAVSCSYLWITALPGLILLRIAHGAVFVLLTSATISILVIFIPPEKSGQGFSILTVATMIPFAVIPPLTETILPHLDNAAGIYAGVSVFSFLGIGLMLVQRRRIQTAIARMDRTLMQRLPWGELRDNFRQRAVALLLGAILFVYVAHATVFYFIKNLVIETGVGDAGAFFGVSMAAMIAVRLCGALILDRLDKRALLRLTLVALILCLAILPHAAFPVVWHFLAVLYGVAMGVALPVLNALLFSASAPNLRGMNVNMTLFVLDGAYFLTPYLGGAFIAGGGGFDLLFYGAAGFVLLALTLLRR
ncbi:MAG: MFS transporter [Pseudomonadota bacterium]|nr:MFS transporter [Pseudomonadota bacterium]